MKALTTPWFVVCCILFVVHQVLQLGLGLHVYWADAWLDNLLAMPIILTLWLAERRLVFKKGNSYRLPLLHILFATVYIALIAEILFPLLSSRSTFDWWDFLFYLLGALLFNTMQRKM